MAKLRKIIHVDMDAFYASVEQRDFSEYRGRPVIVGGEPFKRGVVAACSYEARRYGIRSAMPSTTAFHLCPEAIFVSPRFDAYRQVSRQIQAIFYDYTDRVEPLSLDEAYLDVTQSDLPQGSATLLAKEIKRRILQQTGLTASAGVSYNKFLAKMASEARKPDGFFLITPDQGAAFVEALPIGKFHGIGRATEAKMQGMGIFTGADLKRYAKDELLQMFGRVGEYYYSIARGVDTRAVSTDREPESMSAECTFQQDLQVREDMLRELAALAQEVSAMLKKKNQWARTLVLKVKYADFQRVTRRVTLKSRFCEAIDMIEVLPALLGKTDAGLRKVRLLGVGAAGLSFTREEGVDLEQLDFFHASLSSD